MFFFKAKLTLIGILVVALMDPWGERSGLAQQQQAASSTASFERLVSQHLPNAIRVHASLICGGLPADRPAFAELQQLGVRTIVSVDGAQPDVELAREFGLRYVHLPHGYDGIADERAMELTKALRELPGPIYIHCHHGRHRSPAAAAVAGISAGLITTADGWALLQQAGTSPNYRGLYLATRRARLIPIAETSQAKTVFAERAAVPPLAAAMVDLEHTFGNLKRLMAADWRLLPQHPDIEPRHEALLLREHFTELLRADATAAQPPAFHTLVRDGLQLSEKLETGLSRPMPLERNSTEQLSNIMQRLADNCLQCHVQFRDIPLPK